MLKPPTASRWLPTRMATARLTASITASAFSWIAALRSWKPTTMTSRPRRRSSLRKPYCPQSRPCHSMSMLLGPMLNPSARITGLVSRSPPSA